jgi:uncharacterized protein YbaR (Trm112 family)
MINATCPECKQLINWDSMPEIGQQLMCVNCSNMLEVTWLFPVFLDYQDKETKTIDEQDESIE